MYRDYFGLREKPFAIAPNPRYLYLSELHREALAHLLYGISNEGCIILLTGEVGTGKTTICRCLLEQLPENTQVAMVLNPKLTIEELLQTICEELGISTGKQPPSSKESIDRLNAALLAAHARGENTALIIDEAQNLSVDLLEQLRLLTNLETNSHKLLQIVLIGQPELRRILDIAELAQLRQRITTRYHLQPLSAGQVGGYIRHRLAVAGASGPRPLFSPAAVREVARVSKGIPRVINILCDRALLGAYAEDREEVDGRTVRRAAKELFARQARQRGLGGRRRSLATLLILLALAIPLGLYLALPADSLPLPRLFLPLLETGRELWQHLTPGGAQ